MADGYSVKVDSRRVVERLQLLRDAIGKRPDRATAAIREVMTRRVMERFATKTDPDGIRWDNWAASTQYMREKEGGVAYKKGPVSLLEHTGEMRDSFVARTRGGTVRLGFGVGYAQYHETGTRKKDGSVHMPARRVLTDGRGGLSRRDRIAVGLAVRKAVVASISQFLDR